MTFADTGSYLTSNYTLSIVGGIESDGVSQQEYTISKRALVLSMTSTDTNGRTPS